MIIAADYDPSSGRLRSLTDIYSRPARAGTSGFNGTNAQETVTDLDGNDTESVYDRRGNLTRQVRPVKDEAGRVLKYVVTVREYSYVEADAVNKVGAGVSNDNALSSMKEWQPFEVPAPDPAGLRFSEAPMANTLVREVSYNTIDPQNPDGHASDRKLPKSETKFGPNGEPFTTYFSNYVLGKPEAIKDADGHTTTFDFDNVAGVLRSATNALGETTHYTYTSNGLLFETYKIRDGSRVVLSSNRYYANNYAHPRWNPVDQARAERDGNRNRNRNRKRSTPPVQVPEGAGCARPEDVLKN